MISNKALLLLAVATFLTLAHGIPSKSKSEMKHPPPSPITTTPAPNNTTTVEPKTTVPPAPNTTVPPAPDTTVPPAPDTTVSPTPKTTTATPATTTTTVAPPVVPLPPPTTGKWAFYDSKNNTCVIIQMAVQLNITYPAQNKSMKYATFNLPKNETIVTNGSCGETEQFITLSWPAPISGNNSVTFWFSKNATSAIFVVDNVEFNIIEDSVNFPGSSEPNITKKLTHDCNVTVSLQKSYLCSKKQVIVLDPVGKNNSTVSFAELQIQAFHSEKGDKFDSAEVCDMADVSDVVPIAVGCALGGLVLIVLITYLIGRHRQRGYLSM